MKSKIGMEAFELMFENWKSKNLNTKNFALYTFSSLLMIWVFPVMMSLFPPINLFLFMAFWAVSPIAVALIAQRLIKTRKAILVYSLSVPCLSLVFVGALYLLGR